LSKRRVVITGLGIVSPVGSTVDTAWRNVLDGKSGIGPITRFDVSAFPVRFHGPVADFNAEQYLPAKELRKMDPFMHYGYGAAADAIKDSGIAISEANAHRIGVIMGAGIGGLDTIEENYRKYAETQSPKRISPFFVPGSIINMISGHISI
jgi:3-oxoacyl-[acyl-carrier-protein] synthase II